MLLTATATATVTTATTAAGDHPGFLSPSGVEIAFLLVGLATLGAAVITVTTKQLVHAALWLVVALGGLAVEYLLLTAEFIAWVQVLIYVGSVVVLLLFGLMLTRAPIGRSPDADSGNRWVALGVAVAAAAALVWVVVDAFRTTWIDLDEYGPGIHRGHRLLPVPELGAALRGALRPVARRPRRRDRPVPQKRHGRHGPPRHEPHGQAQDGAPGPARLARRSRHTRPGGAELMHLAYPAVLAALLFCVGLYGVLARRNAILVLMSVELMLNAVNLNLVAFDVWLRDTLHSGQALTLFTIAIAAAEIGIGLAIVLAVYRNRGTSDIDRLRDTAETDDAEKLPETAETDTDGTGTDGTEPTPGRADEKTGKTKKAEATT